MIFFIISSAPFHWPEINSKFHLIGGTPVGEPYIRQAHITCLQISFSCKIVYIAVNKDIYILLSFLDFPLASDIASVAKTVRSWILNHNF